MDNDQRLGTRRALLEKYLQVGTVEHLATTLRRQSDALPQSPYVAIHAEGARRPFFFLHGDPDGVPLWCLQMVHELDPDQPVYALHPYGLRGARDPPAFAAIAAEHLKTVRAIQPEGPYLLGGWCNGGLVAYEMAQQLGAQGQPVDLLVPMEPWAPAAYLRPARWAVSHIGRLARLDPHTQLSIFLFGHHLYRRLQDLYNHLRGIQVRLDAWLAVAGRAESGGTSGVGRPPHTRRSWLASLIPTAAALYQDWEGILMWLTAEYVPPAYPGRVTPFWASEEPVRGPRARRVRWRRVAKATQPDAHVVVDGTHMTCRTEHVHGLAAQLRERLNAAEAAGPPPELAALRAHVACSLPRDALT